LNNRHIREEDLELFALGALSDDEAAAVRAHVSTCSECTPRLAEVRGRTALLALAGPQQQPRPEVREQLLAKIATERRGQRQPPLRSDEGRSPFTAWWTWVLVPASLALALICLLLSWQNRRLGEQLRAVRLAAQGIANEEHRAEDLARTLMLPDTVTVKLAGTSQAPGAVGVVKFNQRLGVMLYAAQELPALPSGKTYQMWLVPASGAPISAGIFKPEEIATRLLTAQVPPNTIPKAFAVTVEPDGGGPQPTGRQVLLGAS
jgi:anti-sigma-K factor RskA